HRTRSTPARSPQHPRRMCQASGFMRGVLVMHSREFGRRPLPAAGRQRQIFKRRRALRSKPLLVTGTIVVCVALVFTLGFKLGRSFQADGMVEAGRVAVTTTDAVIRDQRLVRE